MQKLEASNSIPRYIQQIYLYGFLKIYFKKVHNSTTDNNPEKEEPNDGHEQNRQVKYGIAAQWSKKNEQFATQQNLGQFHKQRMKGARFF